MALSSRSAAGGRGRPRLGRSSRCGLLGWGALGEALGEARGPEGDGLGTPLRGAPVRASTGASGPWTIRASLWGWHVARPHSQLPGSPRHLPHGSPHDPRALPATGRVEMSPLVFIYFHLSCLNITLEAPRAPASLALELGRWVVSGSLGQGCTGPASPQTTLGPAQALQGGRSEGWRRLTRDPPLHTGPSGLTQAGSGGRYWPRPCLRMGPGGPARDPRPRACRVGFGSSTPPPPGWSRSPLKEPFSVAGGCGGSPLPAWCPALPLAPPGRAATALMLL